MVSEVVNAFMTGKSVILTCFFYGVGKIVMETCGREMILAKEKIMEEEAIRVIKLEAEIERRKRECSPSDTRMGPFPQTEF